MAVATDQQEATFSFPILKTETTADGDLMVYGKATDGTVDSDDQIVDSGWSAKALSDWLASGANLRVQHNPHRDPAGVGLQVDVDRDGDGSHYLKALVCEPTAKKLVSKGALRAFSVGIMRPRIVTDIKARGGRIVDGELGEVSLVDRPANRNCSFTLVKADKKGRAAWIGALNGDPDFLAKSLTPKPSDVARMLNKHAVEPPPVMPDVTYGTVPGSVFADPVAARLNEALRLEKEVQASGRVVDSSGKDRSDVDDKDFAGPGKTFPIASQDDVSDAASLAHHAANPGAVRSRIRSIANRKWPGMKLPPSLSGDGDKSMEPELAKAGMKACTGCGKNYHADSKMVNCENCGKKLPVAKGGGLANLGDHKAPPFGRDGKPADDDEDRDNEDSSDVGKGGGLANFDGHKAPPFGPGGKPKPEDDEDDDDDEGSSKVAKGHDQDSGDRMQENDENSGSGDGGPKDNDDDDDSSADHGAGGAQDTADDSGVGEEDDMKAAKVKMYCPGCGTRVRRKTVFCSGCGAKIAVPDAAKHVIPHSHPSPGDGVRGKKTRPAARHREPDGPQTENFEEDAGMQDGDSSGKQPEPSPTWSKKERGSTDPAAGVKNKPGTAEGPDPRSEEERDEGEYMVGHGESDDRSASPHGLDLPMPMPKMRVTSAPYSLARMHDALCAAYDGAEVLAEYPSLKSYADAVSPEQWREAAQQVVAAGNMAEGQVALAVAAAAEALKAMDEAAVADGRAMLHKDFMNAYPSVHLSPGTITAQRFRRPYISEGHAPLSAQPSGPQPDAPVPPGSPSASQFNRGPITEGHESPSPGNGGNRVPSFSGPSMGHLSAPKGAATSAIAIIHDHVVAQWPDLCPMSQEYEQPVYRSGAIDATGGAGSQIADQIRRHTGQRVTQNITKSGGLVPVARPPKKITKAAAGGLSEQALKSALAAELSKVTEALTEQITTYREASEMLTKQVSSLQAQVNEIGSQPDPFAAPPRSAVMYAPDYASPGGAGLAERRSAADEMSETMRDEKLRFLKSLANSGDPVVREGAQAQIHKLLMA